MGNHTGRKIYLIHKWCGLFAALFIFLLGVTGSILVFNHEIDVLEHKKYWSINNSSPVSIDNAYQTILKEYSGWDIRLSRFSANPNETLIFNLRKPDQRLTIFVHPSTGRILKDVDTNKTVVFWILKLHYALHAGLAGEILVLVFGLAYLISLLTGCIVYRKALIDMFLFRIKFQSKKKRSTASSLHRYVGVWGLVFNLIIVFTGLVISYEVVSNGINAKALQSKTASPPTFFSADKILSDLAKAHPEFQPSYIRFPASNENPVVVNGTVKNEPFYFSKYYNSFVVDISSGKVNTITLNTTNSGSTKLSSIVRGIHFVEFGNLPIKILFFIIGLSAPVLSITGFLLWKWKKRKGVI